MCINTIVVHGILEEGKCKPILYYTTSDDKRACLEVSEGDQLNYFKCWYGEKEPLGEQARMMPQKLQRLSDRKQGFWDSSTSCCNIILVLIRQLFFIALLQH